MSTLRVLVLADARSFHTQRFVEGMRDKGIEVDLASCEFEGSEAIPIGKQFANQSWRYHFGVSDVRAILKAQKYDLVNAHFVSGYGFLATRAVPQNIPVVMHAWGSDILIVPNKSLIHRWKTKYAIKRANVVIADSDYLAAETKRLCLSATTEVILWGVESKYLQPIVQKELATPLRLISPRRLEPIYGIKELILDLRNELKSGNVTLTIPGFGSQRNEIEAFIAKENIPGISFYDLLSRDRLMELLRQHDCYCSNSASDSSPVSLLEAMAVGLFPIVKDHPGVRSWMRKDAGVLVGRDCESFADAVHLFMSGNRDVNAIRVSNQERVKIQAIWEENVATTIRAFEQVIASR